MKAIKIEAPSWGNDEKTVINCMVDFGGGLVPFSAALNDGYQHSVEIFQHCQAGKAGEIAAYVAPVINTAAVKKLEIMGRLAEIDAQSARPLRDVVGALVAGQPAPEFAAGKLAALEAEAATLRAELAGLA